MWITILLGFSRLLGGAFLCNALPHLLAGLMGMRFPSPFADPPGIGESSAIVNVLWGLFNLFVGITLLLKLGEFKYGANGQTALVWIGVVGMACGLAIHFESVRYGNPGLRMQVAQPRLDTAPGSPPSKLKLDAPPR